MAGLYHKRDRDLERKVRIYLAKVGTFWALMVILAITVWAKPHEDSYKDSFNHSALESLINKAASDLIVCQFYLNRDCTPELNRLLILESMRGT